MPNNQLTQFAAEVTRLMPDIMRQFLKRQTREIAQGKISLAQMLILDILKDKDCLCMTELAKYLTVSTAAATGLVDKLVKNNLVIRSGVSDDRRIVNIKITPCGKKIIEKCNLARQKSIIEIFGNLSALDREKYLEILSKIHKNLNEAQTYGAKRT